MLSIAQELFEKVRHRFYNGPDNYPAIQRASTSGALYRIVSIHKSNGGETDLTPNMTSRELAYFLAGIAFTNETQRHHVWGLK